MKRLLLILALVSPAWAGGPWFVSASGSDSNNCLAVGTPCLTIAHAEALSSAGDTINIAAGTYRLSTSNSSTAGLISAKASQTFKGPACTPKVGPTPCTAIVSGGTSIGGAAVVDGSDWKVTGQTQAGTVTAYPCDPAPYDGCNLPEDLFYDGVPLIHILSATRPTLVSGQWWFDYPNDVIYFHQTPVGHTVETSVLQAMFAVNGVNGVTVDSLTLKEFAAPLVTGAITPANAPVTNSLGIDWTVQNSYLTLNHGMGVETAFGLKVLNSVLTLNGQFGVGGGAPAGVGVLPSNIVIQGNLITFNNYARVDPGSGAGGIKFGNVAGAVIRGNTVSNNLGNAIHFDTNSIGGLVDGNDVEDNFDPTAVSGGSSSGWGIVDEISQGGLVARNNYVKFIGAGGAFAIVSSTSVGMQAYCNVVQETTGITNELMSVVGSNRGNRNNQPNLGTPFVSTGNYFHHNTMIWDAGATGHAGYKLFDTVNQPNFFANNTPPDFNTYHAPTTTATSFYYDNNNSGSNTPKTFANYKAAGADVHGTIDTINTSGFPTVVITAPTDQSAVGTPVTVAATASDSSGISKVEFYVDWNLNTTVTSPPFNFNWSSGTIGAHTVAAMAYSNAGIRACNAVTLNVAATPAPPSNLKVVVP